MSEMTNVQKLSPGPRLQLAAVLAPAFVQRYDFSDPKNYDAIADQAFKLAGIMIERVEAMTAEAKAKDQVIADKLAAEKEKQRLKDEAAKRESDAVDAEAKRVALERVKDKAIIEAALSIPFESEAKK